MILNIIPKYDNYDAINVNKVKEIPCDYNGVIGVPVTFYFKYNSEQFEIVGFDNNPVLNNKGIYKRLLIRHKNVSCFADYNKKEIGVENDETLSSVKAV
jgi:hypothetical protein